MKLYIFVKNIIYFACFVQSLHIHSKNRNGDDKMNSGQATIDFRSLSEELILATATKERNCSQEELYFSLNCVLRLFHAILTHEETDIKTTEYTQTQFCTAYNILTGQTIYPF